MHRGRSTNWFFSIPLLGLVQACSSDSDPAQQAWNLSDSDPTQRAANCISPDDSGVQVTPIARAYELVCALDGFPFALSVAAFSVNDASLRVTQPEADALCLSGAVSEKVPSWAGISLQFSARSADRTQVLSVLDLDARGITQLAFTLESAPSTGLMIEATTITSLSCPGDPRGCATPVSGFALMDGPGSPTRLSITSSGRVVAPFANFEAWNAVSGTFDTSALDHIAFRTGGTYDFCLSDFAFLDASGRPVQP